MCWNVLEIEFFRTQNSSEAVVQHFEVYFPYNVVAGRAGETMNENKTKKQLCDDSEKKKYQNSSCKVDVTS